MVSWVIVETKLCPPSLAATKSQKNAQVSSDIDKLVNSVPSLPIITCWDKVVFPITCSNQVYQKNIQVFCNVHLETMFLPPSLAKVNLVAVLLIQIVIVY